MKRLGLILLLAALCASLCLGACAEGALPAVGEVIEGFEVKEISRLDLVGADVVLYEHQKTGAQVMYLANEDLNRAFSITFRTPVPNDRGVPHIFEHATLDGSAKYPSKALFFNLISQTYNTFMNAGTYDIMTSYPLASLSEAQLLKYVDYYVDSAFHPLLMTDESIFLEEAWRYAMTDADSPLTIAGTVYSEMQGAYTLTEAAGRNAYKTLFPGSTIGNSYGGNPVNIPEVTWDEIKAYHDSYYHPSNSLTCMYGKYEDVASFLKVLDSYFSAFEKKEFLLADEGYTPLTENVQKTFEYGVEAGSDTVNGTQIYYGFVCENAPTEDVDTLYMMMNIINNAASDMMQTAKELLPSASISGGVDFAGPEFCVLFTAAGVNAEDADTFKRIVDESLARSAKDGFDSDMVEAIAASLKLSTLLSTESSSVGVDLMPNIAYQWAAQDDVFAYARSIDMLGRLEALAQSGAYQKVIEKYLLNSSRSALVVTTPVAGLKDKEDQALADKLAAIKAEMTPEEIAAIVERTATFGATEENDSAEYIKQIQAVTVDSLPEECRIYDITDETGEDGVRRLTTLAEVSDFGQTVLLLNVDGIAQEDLHWLKLYTELLGDLDTSAHDNATLSSLITRYLYSGNIYLSSFTTPEGEYRPYLRCSWIATDEDMQAGYDLIYEMLYDTNLTDAKKILDQVTKTKTGVKQNITSNAYNILVYRAFATNDPSYAGYHYVNHLDYYAFLEETEKLLQSNPEAAIEKLQAIQRFCHNGAAAVSGFAGSAQSAANHRAIADAFLAKLDKEERVAVKYDFPAIESSEALIIDSAVQYNMIYAPLEDLGIEEYTASLDAITALVTDAFLYPQLRDQYGAYGVMHFVTEYGGYIVSYRDPNVAETFEVYGKLADMMRNYAIDQETLDGYILSAYNIYALSEGELTGATSAMLNLIDGNAQERVLKWMKELKAITADKVNAYADMYQKLYEKGMIATAGGAAAVNKNAALYKKINNPFGVADATQVTLTDVTEGEWYYDAVRFVFENSIMSAATDTTFGVADPTTIGEIAGAMYGMLGATDTPEACIAFFAGYGVLPAEAKAEDTCTREELATYLYSFCAAMGMDVEANLLPLPKLDDAADISSGFEPVMQFVLSNQLMTLATPTTLAPQAPAARADLAYALAALNQ